MNGNKNQGFTLIEMLVTLLIGTVLLLALGAVMSGVVRSQQVMEDYEEIQETLRFTTAMLSRSLRTAQSLTGDTQSDQLVLTRKVRKEPVEGETEPQPVTLACNGTRPDADEFEEVYFLDGDRLMCEVDENKSPVTLAYGIKKIEFFCAEYSNQDKVIFTEGNEGSLVACDVPSDHSQIIAVKTTITFDASKFRQLDQDKEYKHSFVTTLRTRLDKCADNVGNDCP